MNKECRTESILSPASALPTSTAKNPRCEVFVQGDQRKAIYEFVERNGLDRKYVHLHDGVKK